MEQYRVVDTPQGALTYLLVKKRLKNLNLRLNRQGQAILSVPLRCPEEQADQFIREKSGWILRNQPAPQSQPLPPPVDREKCKRLLGEAVLRVYPLVSDAGVPLPQVRVRKMKSQWGNCHYRQGYITLNSALARCPQELRDYVALHELVHFLHHDHGPGFYAAMDIRMPDWRRRRKALREYICALDE